MQLCAQFYVTCCIIAFHGYSCNISYTGVWTNFELRERNLLTFSALDMILAARSGVVKIRSNALKAKILHSLSQKLVQTPDHLDEDTTCKTYFQRYFIPFVTQESASGFRQ